MDDLKWAREVADGYLSAASLKGLYHGTASGWTTPTFRERAEKVDLRDYWFTDWQIHEQKPSPARDEVIYQGDLTATWSTSSRSSAAVKLEKPSKMTFKLRVTKDPCEGKFRVDAAEWGALLPEKAS